jgi:predicted transcriptional regulator
MKPATNVSVSFRVSERFKALLDAAAANQNRSRTNLVETLLFSYCDEHKIEAGTSTVRKKLSKGIVKK